MIFDKVPSQLLKSFPTGNQADLPSRHSTVGLAVKALPLIFFIALWLAQAGTAIAGATLTVNTNADNTTADTFLSLREAIIVARSGTFRNNSNGGLGRCLTNAELGQISGAFFVGNSLGAGCWTVDDFRPGGPNIGEFYADDIVFSSAVSSISVGSKLPGVGCNDDINGLLPNGSKVEISGSSAGSAHGLRLAYVDTENTFGDALCGTSGNQILNLVIRGFSGCGIIGQQMNGGKFEGLEIHNNGADGILLIGVVNGGKVPRNNRIGGSSANQRNLIYSNGGHGIAIRAPYPDDRQLPGLNNIIENNFIGTGDGGNDKGNAGAGVYIENAFGNVIGGDTSSSRNVISGNDGPGIQLFGPESFGNLIFNNFIGTNRDGNARLGNDGDGVVINGGASNFPAGGGPNKIGDGGKGNVIAANLSGVIISGAGTMFNIVRGNYIGTNTAFASGLGNNAVGVGLFNGAHENTIGGGQDAFRNYIVGSSSNAGVIIADLGTNDNAVQKNYIGTTGTTALPNAAGVFIQNGASNNSVTTNLISGNSYEGIVIRDANTTGNTINSNGIGINAAGAAQGNGTKGVIIAGPAGSNLLINNTISGNGESGVWITGSNANQLFLNKIGTNSAGTSAVPNGGSGVDVTDGAKNNVIGNVTQGNIISGNASNGITLLSQGTLGNAVYANLIGVNAGEDAVIGNGVAGIAVALGASSNYLGGGDQRGNVIGGNFHGVGIYDPLTNNNLIRGNYIGINHSLNFVSNIYSGILIGSDASYNSIGGTAPGVGNVIAGNGLDFGLDGITVQSGVGNPIIGNRFGPNGVFFSGLPIDLGPNGLTPNDPGDADAGANNLQNFPVLSSVSSSSGGTRVQGSLNSAPNTFYTIECYFVSGDGLLSPFGLATRETDNNGNLNFDFTFPTVVPPGADVWAAATERVNGKLSSTSEVSPFGQATPAGCTYSLSPSSQSFAAGASSGSVTVTTPNGCNWGASVTSGSSFLRITASGGNGNGTVTFNIDANAGSSPRSGTINIAGESFTIFQGISFQDVPTNHPFYIEIGKLAARGVTLGCGGSNYCPDAAVTREQMAAFIIRALGEFNPPQPASQRFADVPPANPFYAFIEQMAVRQITLGCSGGNYCPTNSVTREQMAAFLIRALGEFSPPTPPSQRFADVLPANPFYSFIDRLAVLGITQGCSTSPPLYCPTATVTRGQMAAFLVRAFGL